MSEGASERRRRRLGPWRNGLLAVAALLLLALAALAIKVTTPPAPFPIPPDLALDYPQEKFDSPDNARHLYEQFYDLTRAASRSLRIGFTDSKEFEWQGTEPNRWSSADCESARRWVEAYQPALALFREATRKPYFVEAQGDLTLLLPHIGPATDLGKASVYEAELAFRDGDEARAVDAVLPVFVAAAQVTQYGPTISRLIGDALESIALRCIWLHLNDGRLQKFESLKRIAVALDALGRDRFLIADTFRVDYAINHRSLEKWARGKGQSEMMTELSSSEGEWERDVQVWLELRLFYPRPLRNLQQYFRYRVHSVEGGLSTALQSETDDFSGIPRHMDIITQILLPVTRRTVEKEATTNAERRAVMSAVAAARYRLAHGTFPDSGAALVPEFLPALPIDPFDGQSIRTKRDGDAFVIWCIGMDFKDGGGAVAIPRKDWLDGTVNGDLVWRLTASPAKTTARRTGH